MAWLNHPTVRAGINDLTVVTGSDAPTSQCLH
jgi:hypothetical protein